MNQKTSKLNLARPHQADCWSLVNSAKFVFSQWCFDPGETQQMMDSFNKFST